MPIYEYSCPDCNIKFELLRPMSRANEAASCPRCQGNAERILSTFACMAKDAVGEISSIGGSSSCSACSATSCSTCG